MWLFLLLFLVSPVSASVFGSSESPPTEEISNLDADPGQNNAVQGMQDYGKVIRPTKKISNQVNGTYDRCLEKCSLEAMVIEKQAEIDRLNREELTEIERLRKEKVALEEMLRTVTEKEKEGTDLKKQKNTLPDSAVALGSSESPPSGNLGVDSGHNGAASGMLDYGKIIRPVGKNQGNGTADRCLQKCVTEAMVIEKQTEIERLNREKLTETEKLKREKAELEEILKRIEEKEKEENDLKRRQGNTILLMGGYINKSAFDGMAVLSDDRSKWIEPEFKLPYKAGGSCAIYYNEEIYLFGGGGNLKARHKIGEDKDLKVVYKLDKNLKWIRLADMNVGRHGITKSCLEWNGNIWVFGGWNEDKESLKSVERYDPKENKWTIMPEMRQSRAYAAVLLWNDRAIITGGTNNTKLNSVESFNLGHWMELNNMPRRLSGHAIVYYKNMVMIMGGYDGHYELYKGVWKMDPQDINRTWKPLPPLKRHSAGLAGVVLDEEIYVIDGWLNNSTHQEGVEIFDGERWRNGPSLSNKWYGMSAVIIPQNLADRLITYKR